MKNYKYIIFIGLFLISSILYKTILKKEEKDTASHYVNMINKYLINNTSSLGINEKPPLWIHLHNDNTVIPSVNHRHWLSFKSRNTTDFNQPYQYLTIQSIINKCGDDFNIYLINDDSFKKILPEWNVDFSHMSNPIKTHLRQLALCNVLNLYGGLLVPSSFICFKSLKSIYYNGISDDKMFVGEFYNNTSTLTENSLIASSELMGCNIGNPQMKEFIKHLEILNSKDFTADVEFLGINHLWLQDKVNDKLINSVSGYELGIKQECGKIVNINDLTGSSFINLDNNAVGLYIPWNELIQRTNLQWFVRLSPKQVLQSNTMIGKYLLSYN